jgi:hypothetical protein
MAIIASSKATATYEPVPAGNYVARCYSMVHMGTVMEEIMGEKKLMNKVRLTWELPTETKVFKEENGEQPFVLSKDFTLSMHEKSSMRKWLEAWRGKTFTQGESEGFDITKLVGAPCMLNVIHVTKGEKTYANISNVSSMPKGLVCPPQITPSFVFSVLEFDQAKFDVLPDFIKDKIKTSKEYQSLKQPNVVNTASEHEEEESPNDLPF